MKKYFLMLLLLSCCLCLCSCADIVDKSSDNTSDLTIPFLIYENNNENNTLEAKLLYWNIIEGKVVDKNEVAYKMTAADSAESYIEPIIWGKGKFVVNDMDEIQPVKENVIKAENVSMTVWGENIKVVACFDETHNFTGHEITVDENGVDRTVISDKFVVKNERGDNIGVFPSYVRYDNSTGKLTFISIDFSSMMLDNIYVFEAKIDNISDIEMRKIPLSENIETNGNAMPTLYNAVMNNDTYYFQSFNSLAYCNVKTENSNTLDDISNRCRNVVKEGRFNPDFEKAIIPIGSYNDVIIVNVPISTDVDLENIVCAISDNKIIGTMHLKKDGIWQIRNENAEVSDKFDVSNRDLYVKFYEYVTFPKY